MRPSIKKRWLAALRSGKYKKGTGSLKYNDKYCSLGVLCTIMKPSIKKKFNIVENEKYLYCGDRESGLILTREFKQYLNIPDDITNLWIKNDFTETFAEVIEYIKKNL